MTDALDRLLARGDVLTTGPADPAQIDAVAARLGGSLPPEVLAFWRRADGLLLDSIYAQLLGPGEILELIDETMLKVYLVSRGLLPLLDVDQSNFVMLHLRPPLAYRVTYVPHDNDARLLYREPGSLFGSLLDVLDRHGRGEDVCADEFYDQARGEYAVGLPRVPEDRNAARALLATGNELDEWLFAIQLLEADDLEEWARLLETDHMVRREALDRLRQFDTTAVRGLLKADRLAFEDFTARAAEAIRSAGLGPVEVDRMNGALVIGGGRGWRLESFFYRRHIPDALPRMATWIGDQIDKRDPRERPGHFFEDG